MLTLILAAWQGGGSKIIQKIFVNHNCVSPRIVLTLIQPVQCRQQAARANALNVNAGHTSNKGFSPMSKADHPTTGRAPASLSRREAGSLAIVGVLSAVAGIGNAAAAADPIFAAIEAHKAAYLEAAAAGLAHIDVPYSDPQYEPLQTIVSASYQKQQEAEDALLDAIPNSMAGVLALLQYVHDFNTGKFGLADAGWRSEAALWPDAEYMMDGKAVPFAFYLLRNVHLSLNSL